MKNKIYIQYLWFAIFVLMATVVSSQQVDPAEDVTQISYRSVEPPDYYPTRTALTKNEMHVLDTLTAAERTFIESAYDPPAIGVVRDLTDPIRFSMEQNNFLTQDEISVSGGRLTRVTDELLVFTTYFESKKADEIRIFFAEGNFPYGVEVNLFSRDDYAFNQPELVGELDEHGFYTTTTFADYLYLQVVIPLDKVNDNVSFAITRITHVDNRYIPDEISRDCFLDANCSDANNFTHIDGFRRATARLSWPTGGGLVGLCTGTLLNDMRTVDFQPFLLTANHCFSTQNDATGLEARFYYWSTECNSGVVNPNYIIVNGSNLIATNSQTDFTLVLLKQKGGNFYMGWSANSVANNTIMHSVHHPGGTLMKYQRMLNKTSPSWTCDGFSTSNFHYTKATHGQEAPGSSGGGIVDPDGRIRGQLYGSCHLEVWDPCDYNTYYNMWGRFDVTYSNNNIQYWLANGGASVSMYVVNSINFGYVNVGNYNDYNLAIKNNGTRPNFLNLEINNAYITGTNSSHFSIIGSKILYLAPGETGYITVRYKPLESGSSVATLNLVHNADNYTTPRQVTLNGSSSPCSDIISLGGGGYANRKTFSKSGDGVWTTNVCGYNCNGREQIYSFVAPYTGYYSIEVVSTNNTWVDYFWKSGSCSSAGWNCIDFVYSPHVLGSMYWTAGTTYHILLDAEVTSQATHTFFVFYNPCANAIEIAGIGSGYSKTFAGGGQSAWNNTSVSACGYYCYGGERVYSFTAPTTGIYSIQVTSASGYVDYMWKAGICNSTGWECIDDISVPGKYGSMSWTAGTTYYILLDDENTTAGSHTFYINEPEIAGIWLGTTNSNWHTASNWTAGIIPDASIDVVIPGGTTYQPSVQSADAECNNLLLENGASLTIGGTYKLTVNIDANIKGSLIMNNLFSKLYVNRDVKWFAGSSAYMTTFATIYLKRTWEFMEGANIALTKGFVVFFGSGNSYIRSNDANSYFNNIRNSKTGTALAHSAASNYPCRLNGNLYIYSNCKFTSYSTQKFIIGGYIENNSGVIELDSGTIEFGGGGGTSYFMPGDYFNNLVINSTDSVTFNNNMEVRGSLSIISGTLNLLSTTLNVKGNWTNSIFPAGFDAGSSRVRFTGPGHQYVTTSETFNILEVANGAALRVDASTSEVTCNQYDWTSGGIDVIKGTFTALDLAQNGIYGSYYVNPGGVINLEKINGWVDFNGHIYIFGGEFNIYGGTSDSYWPYQANASLTMSGGTLDFKDVGIVVYNSNSFTFTHDITGGTIRTIGGLTVYRSDFTPAGGVFEFYGSNDRFISVAIGSQLQHVTINKSGKAATTAIPEEPLYDERSGMMLGDGSRANNITLDTDVTILGNLNITAGSLTINDKTLTVNNNCFIYGTLNVTNASDVFNAGTLFYNWLEFKSGSTANITDGTIMNGYPVEVNNNFTVNKGEIRTAYSLVKILGNLEINNGGNLTVNSGGGIAMGASRSITVNNGGKIELNGVLSNPALVTRISSGNYAFNIESGGTIAAEYGLFEHMNSGGINIKSGAIVDPDHSFNNSTFRNGASGGRLLTVNNNQNFTVNNAIFPSNTWGGTYNVYKNINSGIVTFSNATGAFSGSAHEYDPYNRIFWGDEPLVHTIQVPAGWSGLSSYIMPLNTDITEIFSPVFSDFIMAQTMSSAYYPAGGINTIVNWQSQSAYKVKMVQEAFLPISGDEETNKTLALSVGWSLVPVICNTPVSASSIFSGSGFTLAKDVAGVGVYWPSMGINTLGNLLPGRAYYAYFSSPKNITFPPNSKQSWAGYYPTIPVINHPWNDVEVSGSSHLIAIQVESCKGLLPGDVIGVFSPDQLCFGVVEISDLQNNALLIAWADDPLTAEKDGFEEMDLMNYKLYRPQSGELFDLDVEYDQDLPQTGYFYGEGLSAIKTLKMTSLGSYEALASIVSLYPNPTTGIIWAKGIKDFTKIEIYNSIGNCIKTFVNQSDDNLEIDLSVHSSGVYHIKFIGKESSIIKRVVKK